MKKTLLIGCILSFSLFANPADQKHSEKINYTNNSTLLSLVNGVASAGLIKFVTFQFKYKKNNCIYNIIPIIAVPEIVCSTASSLVDVNDSTKNSIIGWGNVVWGGAKLLMYVVGAYPIEGSITTALCFSTIATNVANATYRLWYAGKHANTAKK